jgi:hypothetical protein
LETKKMKLTVVSVAMGDPAMELPLSFIPIELSWAELSWAELSWAELILALLYPLSPHTTSTHTGKSEKGTLLSWLSDYQMLWENGRISNDMRWIGQTIAPPDPERWLGEGGGGRWCSREEGEDRVGEF